MYKVRFLETKFGPPHENVYFFFFNFKEVCSLVSYFQIMSFYYKSKQFTPGSHDKKC